MTDAEILAQKVKERVRSELHDYFGKKVVDAHTLLHSSIRTWPVPIKARTIGEAVDTAYNEWLDVKVQECLPKAMEDVLSKVTFNVLKD